MTDVYEAILKARAQREEAALVTIISALGSTPREAGSKMLVGADGSIVGTIGGGGLEKQAIEAAKRVSREGRPERLHIGLKGKEAEAEGMICGGEVEIFIEPILSAPTLFIFGGGHIARPLAAMGRLLGFSVTVIDDRAEFASRERFPEADNIVVDDFSRVLDQLQIDQSGYIVIITRGHQSDETVLAQAVATRARYIGMIGSQTKNQTIFSRLAARGVPREQLDRVHAPIGLEINARTPEEIAVSILAEIIMVRRSA